MDAGASQQEGGYSSDPRLAELYDHVVPYRERPDVGFYVDQARTTGGPVLELGCGTGRVLIPIARSGIEITGLDSSSAMLARCREKLGREAAGVQAQATVLQADMRDFDLGREFKLITTPFRSFQHLLSVEDQLACLECIRRHLAHDGRMVLDLFNPSISSIARQPYGEILSEEPEFVLPDGTRCTRRHRILGRDHFKQLTEVELLYDLTYPDGRSERLSHAFTMRHLFRYEAEHLLVRAGFRLEALYSDYQHNPFGAHDPGELVFVARRRE